MSLCLTPDIIQGIPRLLAYLSSFFSSLLSHSGHLDLLIGEPCPYPCLITLGASLPFSLLVALEA